MTPRFRLLPLSGLLTALVSAASAQPSAELVEARKIWDAAPHNAFTDLVRHQDHWYCVFREGTGHVPGSNGVIRVLRSATGDRWDSAARVAEQGIDLRDPKISVTPDGRLMLLLGGSAYDGEERPQARRLLSARTRVAFSRDGTNWTAPTPVSVPDNNWLWRVTWRQDAGYGFSYNHGVPLNQMTLTLWRTTNGVHYEKIVTPAVPTNCWPDEATIRFRPDGLMLALVRNDRSAGPAFIGRSVPPYTDWTFVNSGQTVQGPNFIVLPDGRMVYAGRVYSGGAKTVVGGMTPERGVPWLTLPSGGDTSYPGLAWHEGLVWVSYYSSHEGKTAIYLAKVRCPPERF